MKKYLIPVCILLMCSFLLFAGCKSKEIDAEQDTTSNSSSDELISDGVQGDKGGQTFYQDVPTDVQKLQWTLHSDMAPVSYVFEKTPEGFIFYSGRIDDDEIPEDYQLTEAAVPERINRLVDSCEVKKWDGFNMYDSNVLDGYGFSLYIDLSTGESISAHGSNAFPSHYGEFENGLENIIAQMPMMLEDN